MDDEQGHYLELPKPRGEHQGYLLVSTTFAYLPA